MLVLSRKPNTSIRIGPDIEVVVLRIDEGKVRLGISAPREVHILREELIERAALLHPPPPAEACCEDDDLDDFGGEA